MMGKPSNQQLEALIQRHRQGDPEAFAELLQLLQPWLDRQVRTHADRYAPWVLRTEVRAQIVQVIWKVAQEKYNFVRRSDRRNRNVNVRACIVHWIRHHLEQLRCQRRGWGERQRKDAPRVFTAQQRLRNRLGREVTTQEIAQATGLSIDRVQQVLQPREDLYADPANMPRDTARESSLNPEEMVIQHERRHMLRYVLAQTAQEVLAPEDHLRFLFIVELKEVRGFSFPQIARALQEESEPVIAPIYVHPRFYTPAEVRRAFQHRHRPPTLTDDGDRLLRWYAARWRKLLPELQRRLQGLQEGL
jgi:hypothetical protein